MGGFFAWLIAVLSCCLVTKTEAQFQRLPASPDNVVQDATNETESKESLKGVTFNESLLNQVQSELNAQLAINSDLRSKVVRRSAVLDNINRGAIKVMQKFSATRNALMKASQLLSQKKVKVDYSWLLMERCRNIQYRNEKVRRIADRLADRRAEEVQPKAKKHYLSKYLRLLEVLQEQVVQETRAGMGLPKRQLRIGTSESP
ncbi:uncharacterized protein LOC108137792 [Drosophila elegans]|uniref:uncharacterized protein LOC108137792 n=1 Tax=Drosophila elegans TaxID=30023 RepID=UPI0007E6A088|nr:uncharacterized protein LOC108137792 [Drosophila elegans]